MTLREESANGPPADGESAADPKEPVAGAQETAAGAQETATSAAAGEHAAVAEPGPGTGPGSPANPSPAGLSGPASPSLAGPSPASPSPAGLSGPASPSPAGPPSLSSPSPASQAGPPSPGSPSPASPGGHGPARGRRSRVGLLIGIPAAVCLIGLGGFAAVLLLHGLHGLHGRTQATRVALPPVFRLRAGECINSGPAGVSSPTVVPCGQPHDAEIYARFGLAGQRWPGTTAVGTLARQGCTARLSGYLNPQLATSVLAESYVFPDQGAWNAGERTVICEIRGTAGKLTGSVRGLS